MKRLIFSEPIPIDELARKVITSIFDSDPARHSYHIQAIRGCKEESLSRVYRISRRKIRQIVERYNFNKYLGIDTTIKIKVINGRYRLVKDELIKQVAAYHRANMMEYIIKGAIMSKALNGTNIGSMTISELMEANK